MSNLRTVLSIPYNTRGGRIVLKHEPTANIRPLLQYNKVGTKRVSIWIGRYNITTNTPTQE